MQVKLGLYAVDPLDPAKRRAPRSTVDVFREIAAAGAVTDELRTQYPIDLSAPRTGGVPLDAGR
jgi:hypothetical protein